jgi:signal transduction histidine kinase
MLRAGILKEERRNLALETVERNATTLSQMVEDVLDVSRIAAGKIRLHIQPVDLPAVVRDALATVAPAADAKGVRLQPVIESDVGRVSGDPDRLQQVIWNLLSNAVKFAPRGGRVQLRLQRVNSHVELSVSDTGIGIGSGDAGYRWIRADSPVRQMGGAARDLPAAALTAYARSEDRAKTLRSGFEMHLAKPIEPSEVIAAVASLARRRTTVPQPSRLPNS